MNQNVLKEKESVVNQVNDLVNSHSVVVVCNYRGLTVSEISSLRRNLKEKDSFASVYKNTLVRRATEKDYDELGTYLEGPNLFVFCKDVSDGSLKVLTKFAKKNEAFSIKGGIVDGKVSDAKYITTLANLPSKEGLVSMLLSVLQAPLRNLAYSLDQIASQKN